MKTITPEQREIEQAAMDAADAINATPWLRSDDSAQRQRDSLVREHGYQLGRRAGLAEALAILRDTDLESELEALEEAWIASRTD